MTAISAKGTAGVDVKRSSRIATTDVAVGGSAATSAPSGRTGVRAKAGAPLGAWSRLPIAEIHVTLVIGLVFGARIRNNTNNKTTYYDQPF
jgi:hypothetical protein